MNKRFVTGGMDGKVKIWEEKEINGLLQYICTHELKSKNNTQAHDDWVRDVAWSQNIG